jgi:hypothetical protein
MSMRGMGSLHSAKARAALALCGAATASRAAPGAERCATLAAPRLIYDPTPRHPVSSTTTKSPEVILSAATFPEFESDAKAQGFDEVLERRWAPDVVLDEHVHPFAVKARVVQGDLWLTVGKDTRHLRTDDTFELPRDVLHAECYGSEGATFWVARRH